MANLESDFLIVGSGIAALRAAIELADAAQVLILTKGGADEGSTAYAQGGIAAAIGPDDSPDRHAADTITAGDGLCHAAAVRVLTEEGPRHVRELITWGARFEREPDGTLALAREAAHAVRRVLHARDATGREMCRVLWQQIAHHPQIRVLEHTWVVDVIVADQRCAGVRFLDAQGRLGSALASATLLATGGAGRVFRETTNPPVATGDGIAIAYRAGARVTDLEFVQFHPTALAVEGAPRFLLSEALRGEGARLVNEDGDPFMSQVEPAGDLAPRDRVARGIAREIERAGGRVYLTLESLSPEFVRRRFPIITETCRQVGLDLARDRVPVGPAAHYIMGGVEADLDGRTSVSGLFAAGEVACSGVHGANRLASNSLLEGLVFGAAAGRAMQRWAAQHGRASRVPDVTRGNAPAASTSTPTEAAIQDLLWREVGLFREAGRLSRAIGALDDWASSVDAVPIDMITARVTSLITVGRLIARAALRREESRGAHFRSDFPRRNDRDWVRHVAESKGRVTRNDVGETDRVRD